MTESNHSTAPGQLSRGQKIAVLLIANLFVIMLAEGAVRVGVAATSGRAVALAYGFDGDLRLGFDRQKITAPRVYRKTEREDSYSGGAKALAAVGQDTSDAALVAVAFGGSTTAGYSCSPHASSWPEELDRIDPRTRVVNQGLSGANSDLMLDQLQLVLQDGSPDVVLWANWINEMDVAVKGLRRNRERIGELRPELAEVAPGQLAGLRHFWRRVSQTIADRSLGYALFREGVQRSVAKSREQKELQYDPRLVELGALNYALNLQEAARLSEQRGFELVVVRMPTQWSLWEQANGPDHTRFMRTWDSLMVATLEAEAPEHGFSVIDVHRAYYAEGDTEKYFCPPDPVHQSLSGHRRTAEVVSDQLHRVISGIRPPVPIE